MFNNEKEFQGSSLIKEYYESKRKEISEQNSTKQNTVYKFINDGEKSKRNQKDTVLILNKFLF